MNPKKTEKPQLKTILTLFAVYGLLALFVAWRLFAALRPLLPGLTVHGFLLGQLILCALLPVGFFLPHTKFSKLLQMTGNHWVSLQITLFFSALLECCAKLVLVRLLHIVPESLFSIAALILFGVTAAFTVYGAVNMRSIRLTRYDCPVDKKNFRNRRLRVVHLSDLHLSSVNDLKLMRRIVERVNGLEADLICITGDTFTENMREIFDPDAIAEAFRGLHSRYGTFTCLGNHDSGPELPQMKAFFKKSGIRLLEDETVSLPEAVLLGRLDPSPHVSRKSVQDCLAGSDAQDCVIVMDHQPGDIEGARQAGADILLSGHTHGGQFYPLNRLIAKVFPHYYGCRQYGPLWSIVSAGTCTAVPHVRVIGHSEIILVTVTGADGK